MLPGKKPFMPDPQGHSKGSGCSFPNQELLCSSLQRFLPPGALLQISELCYWAHTALSSLISLGYLRDEIWEDRFLQAWSWRRNHSCSQLGSGLSRVEERHSAKSLS